MCVCKFFRVYENDKIGEMYDTQNLYWTKGLKWWSSRFLIFRSYIYVDFNCEAEYLTLISATQFYGLSLYMFPAVNLSIPI